METDYRAMFHALHPGFFERSSVQGMPEDAVYEEMVLSLSEAECLDTPLPCPDGITFSLCRGTSPGLHEAVHLVDPDWVQYFGPSQRVLRALDGERTVSFCVLDSMGSFAGLRIAGPGCVGTVPDMRHRGIGQRMVQIATAIFRYEGYDLSYIHYTGVSPFYAGLGYETVLRWNRAGFI